jgi:hypothetical protein
MQSAALFIEATDPTGPVIVVPVPPKHAVHLIDKLQCQILEFLAPSLLMEAEKVTDCESVGP